ncbi:MAG TPA: hypothetical protein VHW09_05915 [Bryobacteraceae bacterium]|jgi:hypothetical protein|nr:hypothetical protein [Bryobacteraceae bacterium]
MHTIRLAYATEFLLALIAVYELWSQVGGQSHLDAMPWMLKLALGAGAALAAVKATDAAVSNQHAWNSRTLKWAGILVVLLVACGLASYYSHLYLEDNGDDQPDDNSAAAWVVPGLTPSLQVSGSTPARQSTEAI